MMAIYHTKRGNSLKDNSSTLFCGQTFGGIFPLFKLQYYMILTNFEFLKNIGMKRNYSTVELFL